MTVTATTGIYPGSFDPPTIAHLAVAEAALAQGLGRLDLVLSRDALGKPGVGDSELDARRERLRRVIAGDPRLRAGIRAERLIVDLAAGYDAVIVGADKWRQIVDPVWYGGAGERDRALARLPLVLIAPRGDDDLADLDPPSLGVRLRVLELDARFRSVSSTAIREGRGEAAGWAVP